MVDRPKSSALGGQRASAPRDVDRALAGICRLVLATRLQIKDGFALPSEEPGNGIAWDEAAVAEYLVA